MADGRIIIDTQIDSSGAEKGVSGLGSKLGSAAKTGLKALTGLIGATATALAALGAIGVKYNSDMEQYMSSFTTMLGSAEKATNHLNELKEFAAKTPFELGDLAKASTTLQAFGVNVSEIMPDLKMIGDISLGNKEKFNGLALVFGQVQSQGKLMGQDLLQMINQGFNPLQIISEKTGKSMSELKDEMSKGKISYEMVANAMKTATSEGGKFYNAMEGQSKTLVGQWSNLKDNAKALVGEVFVTLSDTLKNNLMPTALGYIDTLTKAFREKGVTGLVAAVGEVMASIITNIATYLPRVVELAVQIIQNLITGLQNNLPQIVGAAVKIVTSLVTAILTMLPQILEMGMQIIVQLAQGIIQALPQLLSTGSATIMSLVNSLVIALPQLVTAAIGIIQTLVTGIISALPMLIPAIISIIENIAYTITNNIGTIVNMGIQLLLALVRGIVDSLPTLIQKVPEIINKFSSAIYAQLPKILKAGIQILTMLIKGIIQSIPTLIANLPQIIMAIVNVITLYNWANLGKSLITKLGDGIKAMKGNIGSIAKGVAEWIGNGIKNIFKGGVSWGKNLISSIGGGFSAMRSFLGGSARSIATAALNGIKNIFTGGFNIGKNLIQGIWTGIGNMKQWILNKIGGFAGNIINGIKNKFGIHSPSRVMRDLIGVNLVKGIGVGVDLETPHLEKDINANISDLTAKMQATVDFETSKTSSTMTAGSNKIGANTITNNNDNGITQNVTIVNPERTPSENARALKKVGRDLVFA